MYRVSSSLRRCGLALLGGIGAATVWVNLSPSSYYDALEGRMASLTLPGWVAAEPFGLTLLAGVTYVLMPLFVVFLGKEVFEAMMLERDPRGRADMALSVGAAMGGMVGALGIWLLTSGLLDTDPDAGWGSGWPVPLGSDVLLCYLAGRWVFGPGHKALHLVLLIAVMQDLSGLLVLGLATPPDALRPAWLILPLVASVGVWAFYGRRAHPRASEVDRQAAMALPPYLVAGAVCWLGMAQSGLPPALALLPMIPALPHATRSFGLFAEAEGLLHDPLNRITQILIPALPFVLFTFGLTRGGIDLAALTPTTGAVLLALWLGKPLGVMGGALLALTLARAALPKTLDWRDMGLIAVILGIGLTVPALAIDASLPGGATAEAARLGLALSLLAGPAAFGVSRYWQRSPKPRAPKF